MGAYGSPDLTPKESKEIATTRENKSDEITIKIKHKTVILKTIRFIIRVISCICFIFSGGMLNDESTVSLSIIFLILGIILNILWGKINKKIK